MSTTQSTSKPVGIVVASGLKAGPKAKVQRTVILQSS